MNTSLFECVVKHMAEYEDLFHDVAKLCSVILIFFLIDTNRSRRSLLNAQNSLLIFAGLCVHHLVFTKLLCVKFDCEESKE